MSSRYQVTQAGDTLLVDFHDALVYVTLDRWREVRGDPYCEVTFRAHAPGYPQNLHQSRWNIASMSQRTDLARLLTKRYDKPDWHDLIQTLARVAMEARRSGALVQSLADIEVPADAAVVWRVDGWMPEAGVTLLYGDGGTAKSTMALVLACCIELGRPFLGIPVQQGHVLYIDYETDEHQQARRIAMIAAGLNIDRPPVDYVRAVAPIVEWAPDLRQRIVTRKVQCAVIDSLGYAGAALNEAEPVIAVYRALSSLGVPVLAIHHVAKNQDGGSPYGSVYNRNSSRSVIEMRRQQDQEGDLLYVAWYHTKLNDGRPQRPMGMEIEFGHKTTTIKRADIRDVPGLADRLPVGERVLSALRDGAMKSKDLAETISCSPVTLRQTLHRLRQKNKVARLPDGTWGLSL